MDVRSKKEIEFLELKQGNSEVVEYVANSEEHVKFCPNYNNVVAEGSKCIKLESDLRPKIKQDIGYQEIRRFFVLENKCRIYNEDGEAGLLTIRVLVRRKKRIRIVGNCIVIQLGKGGRRLIKMQ